MCGGLSAQRGALPKASWWKLWWHPSQHPDCRLHGLQERNCFALILRQVHTRCVQYSRIEEKILFLAGLVSHSLKISLSRRRHRGVRKNLCEIYLSHGQQYGTQLFQSAARSIGSRSSQRRNERYIKCWWVLCIHCSGFQSIYLTLTVFQQEVTDQASVLWSLQCQCIGFWKGLHTHRPPLCEQILPELLLTQGQSIFCIHTQVWPQSCKTKNMSLATSNSSTCHHHACSICKARVCAKINKFVKVRFSGSLSMILDSLLSLVKAASQYGCYKAL